MTEAEILALQTGLQEGGWYEEWRELDGWCGPFTLRAIIWRDSDGRVQGRLAYHVARYIFEADRTDAQKIAWASKCLQVDWNREPEDIAEAAAALV